MKKKIIAIVFVSLITISLLGNYLSKKVFESNHCDLSPKTEFKDIDEQAYLLRVKGLVIVKVENLVDTRKQDDRYSTHYYKFKLLHTFESPVEIEDNTCLKLQAITTDFLSARAFGAEYPFEEGEVYLMYLNNIYSKPYKHISSLMLPDYNDSLSFLEQDINYSRELPGFLEELKEKEECCKK